MIVQFDKFHGHASVAISCVSSPVKKSWVSHRISLYFPLCFPTDQGCNYSAPPWIHQ